MCVESSDEAPGTTVPAGRHAHGFDSAAGAVGFCGTRPTAWPSAGRSSAWTQQRSCPSLDALSGRPPMAEPPGAARPGLPVPSGMCCWPPTCRARPQLGFVPGCGVRPPICADLRSVPALRLRSVASPRLRSVASPRRPRRLQPVRNLAGMSLLPPPQIVEPWRKSTGSPAQQRGASACWGCFAPQRGPGPRKVPPPGQPTLMTRIGGHPSGSVSS